MSVVNESEIVNKKIKWYKKYKAVSVEPSISLYMLAFMITNVVEQAFFVHKACRVNHKYAAEICDNLHEKQYAYANYQVQITVTNFLQWNDLASNCIPIILVFFMGSWSDRRGRKLPLLIGLIGKLIYSTMIVINSLQLKYVSCTLLASWPLEYVIYNATLPMAFTGADVIIFASAYSYLSDVTTVKNRTCRITIFDACYFSTMPTGIALGRYLFMNVTNKSYTILFGINVVLLIISILYTFTVLKWRTTNKQKPLSKEENIISDFFDFNHVIQSIKCFSRKRTKNGHVYLLPFLVTMMFYRFQREERNYTYLFFIKEMGWDYNKFSNYRTFQTALLVITLLVGVPIMTRCWKLRDTVLILLGTVSHIISRIICIFAKVDWLFYVAAMCSLGSIVAPTLRSLISKAISPSERGRVFSMLSVADNSVPLYSGFLYSQLYNATVVNHPAGFWWLTIGTQVMVFVIIFVVHVKNTESDLIYKEPIEEATEKCLPENNAEQNEKEINAL